MYKRAITQHQSRSCEDAMEPVCKCRCMGALHGMSHKLLSQIEEAVLEEKRERGEEGKLSQAEVNSIVAHILAGKDND